MPSTYDQPPNTSSLLVSRHDASVRAADHGLAEGLNEEADEPPNLHCTIANATASDGAISSVNGLPVKQPQQASVAEAGRA